MPPTSPALPTGNFPRLEYIGDPGTLYGPIEALDAYTPPAQGGFSMTPQFKFLQ